MTKVATVLKIKDCAVRPGLRKHNLCIAIFILDDINYHRDVEQKSNCYDSESSGTGYIRRGVSYVVVYQNESVKSDF